MEFIERYIDPCLAIILILSGFLFVASALMGSWKNNPDNLMEEMLEQVIKNQTNIDVDITPESKEKTSSKSGYIIFQD